VCHPSTDGCSAKLLWGGPSTMTCGVTPFTPPTALSATVGNGWPFSATLARIWAPALKDRVERGRAFQTPRRPVKFGRETLDLLPYSIRRPMPVKYDLVSAVEARASEALARENHQSPSLGGAHP
jgi:hypothetical protein